MAAVTVDVNRRKSHLEIRQKVDQGIERLGA
jgi:hypothetical protein